MKFLVVISCILAVASCFPVDIAEVFLTEDTHGNYQFRIKSKAITRDEERDHTGKTVGAYTYIDPEGIEHKVTYEAAAEEGFNPKSADLPVSVPEGEPILFARAQHLAVVEAEKALYPHGVTEETPVALSDVLAKLVVPEFSSLPAEAIPEEEQDVVVERAEHLNEYAKVLENLANVYKSLLA